MRYNAKQCHQIQYTFKYSMLTCQKCFFSHYKVCHIFCWTLKTQGSGRCYFNLMGTLISSTHSKINVLPKIQKQTIAHHFSRWFLLFLEHPLKFSCFSGIPSASSSSFSPFFYFIMELISFLRSHQIYYHFCKFLHNLIPMNSSAVHAASKIGRGLANCFIHFINLFYSSVVRDARCTLTLPWRRYLACLKLLDS